jgi:hypothetical protein
MPLRCQPDAEPIPGYRLIAPLGDGGFGEIWKCRTPEGRLRAMKVVNGDLAAADAGRRTAEQELHGLRKVAGLRHRALLTPERFDVSDGQLVILMELADGSLWARYRECRERGLPGIPRDELLDFLADAADGLDALREAGLQHLDVKPQNLLLIAGHATAADFGLVRDWRSSRPGAGASPAYSAPETFAAGLSPHCDQYSLAVVYQELLTGTRPFVGTTAEQLAEAHLNGEPNVAPLPPPDREAVARALAKKPSRRFASCAAFVRALREPGLDSGPERDRRLSGIYGPPAGVRPAVIIGLGGLGGEVVRAVRGQLRDTVRTAEACRVRHLYIDSDADAARAAVDGGALDAEEVLPALLQAPTHYSKLRTAGKKPPVNGWFDSGWLKRLAEASSPDGCRGLGRLAFTDHVRAIAQKLEADLDGLARSGGGPPRVIIVAGLSGGTGGGMLFDAAYLAHRLLRRYAEKTQVSGWLLLPSAESSDDRALGNAFAALAELRHFNRLDTTYRAPGDESGERFKSDQPPFTEVVAAADVPTAATALLRELSAPTTSARAAPGECRTFGEARYVWPRLSVLRQAAGQLVSGLLRHWAAGGATTLADPLAKWVAEQWAALGLGPDALAAELRRAVENGAATTETPAAALIAATDRAVRDIGTRLARIPTTLIEQPDIRFAGAEIAVRLLADRVDKTMAYTGPAADELKRMADATAAVDAATAMRCKYQALVLRQVTAIYSLLRGHLADHLREIAVCRKRVADLVKSLDGEQSLGPPATTLLLPPGCDTMADAARQIVAGIDAVRELDRRVQQHLADSAGGLTRACLADDKLLNTLAPALRTAAEALLAPHVTDRAAAFFMACHPDPVAALKAMWDAAAPMLPADAETTIMFAPPALGEVARQAFELDVSFTSTTDEVAVVRSECLPLTNLPQFGAAAKGAYQRRKAAGESPHSRMDVIFSVD